MTDRSGQQLGNYRLLHLLGEGGFAEVYLAVHIHLETEAAIKILHTQLANDDIEQFRAEARIIARLEHPNIVRVLDFGVEQKTPFLVMSYAPFGTLRQRHRKGVPIPLVTVLSYVKQLADALQYAHDQKVIHRDIKPENMLIGRRDEIVLSDFGIALVAQSSRYQATRDVVGTVAYMAPEQIQGKPRPASDQYSLGIVVYEWLSGARPFTGSFTEIAVQHTVAPPPSLHEKLPLISLAVENVILTALAKDPQQRFINIQAFAHALEHASQSPAAFFPVSRQSPTIPPAIPPGSTDTTIVATPPPLIGGAMTPPSSTVQRPSSGITISRRTLLIGLAGLAVAGGASALTWAALAHNPGNTPSPHPILASTQSITPTHPVQPATAIPATSQPTATNTAIPSPTTAPSPQIGTTFTMYRGHTSYIYGVTWAAADASRIASASNDASVQEWNATTGQQYFSYNHAKAVNDVKSSHDKSYIASAGEDSVVQVRNAVDGAFILTYSGHSAAVNTVEWSPVDSRIVSASSDRTVQVWNALTGSLITTYSGHTNGVWAAGWSPDGKYVVSVSTDGTAQVWDANSGQQLVTYSKHSATVRSVSWSPDGSRIATASEDLTVQVWDAATGNTLQVYRGHSALLRTVAWSHDSTRLVSGGKDATAQIWSASSGTTLFTYRAHSSTVFDAQWSPDDTRIASCSTDTTVRVWQAV